VRRAGRPTAERGADAGPAVPRSGAALDDLLQVNSATYGPVATVDLLLTMGRQAIPSL
jgi:hypothetical protein